MRLELQINIGGDHIESVEDVEELVREVVELATRVEAGDLMSAGDRVILRDFNGDEVGYATLVPDWHVGDQVWATTSDGTLVASYIERISESPWAEFVNVHLRSKYIDQVLETVTVDAQGFDVHGKPRLGRQR